MGNVQLDEPNIPSKVFAGVLIVIGIGILGYTGWFTYSSFTFAQNSYRQIESVNKNDQLIVGAESLTQKYTDGLNLVSAKYPASWKLATSLDQSEPNYPMVLTTITSPRGTVLYLNLDWGGRGGACMPDSTDKPFQAGNTCASVETLGIQPSGITNLYAHIAHVTSTSYSETFDKSNIVLTTKHYANEAGSQKYVIGLVASNGSYPAETNKPDMGYVTEDDFFDAYGQDKKWYGELHAYASFNKSAALNSQDALTVKAILKSITINLSN